MGVELRQVRQLIAIVEAGGFRAAAQRLHVAQPALSVSIRKLERAVGTMLLERDGRGTRLTEAGAVFLRDARRALILAEEGTANARLVAAGDAGTVRIGFVGSAVYQLLPAILPMFTERHRGVTLDLQEGSTVDLLPALRDHRVDCAIVRGPLPDDHEFEQIEVERDRLVGLLPADHPLATRPLLDLAALSREPFVLFSRRTVPGLRNAVDALCADAGFVPQAAQEVTQSITMVGLVGSGIGVALSPGVIANLAGSRVRFLPLAKGTDEWSLRLLAVRRRDDPSRALDLFWTCLSSRQPRG